MTVFVFILGIIVYLIMVHPWVFFLLLLPLAIVIAIAFILWLKK